MKLGTQQPKTPQDSQPINPHRLHVANQLVEKLTLLAFRGRHHEEAN